MRAHLAAKLPPTLGQFRTRSNPTFAQPYIAAAFKGGKLLSVCCNSLSGNKKCNLEYVRHKCHTCHAEMAVVSTIKSRGRLHVWSLRFGGKDKSTLLNAKPCTLCKMVMLKRGVKKVTYSNNFGELCSEKLETLETQASGGVKR